MTEHGPASGAGLLAVAPADDPWCGPGPDLDQAVRAGNCPLCTAPAGAWCSPSPASDHLARWLDAYRAGRISRDDLKTAISGLTVITTAQLITPETPAPATGGHLS
jgi:hypothetical protein